MNLHAVFYLRNKKIILTTISLKRLQKINANYIIAEQTLYKCIADIF